MTVTTSTPDRLTPGNAGLIQVAPPSYVYNFGSDRVVSATACDFSSTFFPKAVLRVFILPFQKSGGHSAWWLCSRAACIVLAIAATLKLQHLMAMTVPKSTGLLDSLGAQCIIIGWEFALALYLLSAHSAISSRALALITFGVFAMVNLFDTITGKQSCACFGKIHVQPWITFGLDIFLFIWLLKSHPIDRNSGESSTIQQSSLTLVAVGCLTIAIFMGMWHSLQQQLIRISEWPETPITLQSGGRVCVTFKIHNVSKSPVTVGAVVPSCECLSIKIGDATVPSGGTSEALAIIDLAQKPTYQGSIELIAVAYGEGTGRLFTISAMLHVQALSDPMAQEP